MNNSIGLGHPHRLSSPSSILWEDLPDGEIKMDAVEAGLAPMAPSPQQLVMAGGREQPGGFPLGPQGPLTHSHVVLKHISNSHVFLFDDTHYMFVESI